MYKLIKTAYNLIIPRNIHYKIESPLRFLLYVIFYRGNQYQCQICESKLKKFILINFKIETDNLCPKCGSLSRTRTLYSYLCNEIRFENKEILDFSPHRSIYNVLSKSEKKYIANDFDSQFFADTHYDIIKLPFKKGKFDLIICFHVLEHIPNDNKAIENLHKVLNKNGDLLIQVPLKKGDTDEDLSINDPKQREIRFGQKDHVRVYGKENLKAKLDSYGFKTKVVDYSKKFSAKELKYYGIKKGELIFHCKKIN